MQATLHLTAKKRQRRRGLGQAIDLYLLEEARLSAGLNLRLEESEYVNDAGLVIRISHDDRTSFISLVLCMTNRENTLEVIANQTDHTRVQQCELCSAAEKRPLLDLSNFSYDQIAQTLHLCLWVSEMCSHISCKGRSQTADVHFYLRISVCPPPLLFTPDERSLTERQVSNSLPDASGPLPNCTTSDTFFMAAPGKAGKVQGAPKKPGKVQRTPKKPGRGGTRAIARLLREVIFPLPFPVRKKTGSDPNLEKRIEALEKMIQPLKKMIQLQQEEKAVLEAKVEHLENSFFLGAQPFPAFPNADFWGC